MAVGRLLKSRLLPYLPSASLVLLACLVRSMSGILDLGVEDAAAAKVLELIQPACETPARAPLSPRTPN